MSTLECILADETANDVTHIFESDGEMLLTKPSSIKKRPLHMPVVRYCWMHFFIQNVITLCQVTQEI